MTDAAAGAAGFPSAPACLILQENRTESITKKTVLGEECDRTVGLGGLIDSFASLTESRWYICDDCSAADRL